METRDGLVSRWRIDVLRSRPPSVCSCCLYEDFGEQSDDKSNIFFKVFNVFRKDRLILRPWESA
jgi:hypothetical protein